MLLAPAVDLPAALAGARALLARYYGYPDFRPSQRRVVASVLAGRDVLGVLPTGAGKSVCFQIPAMQRDGLTLVVSPLISLMQDQVDAARRRGIPAAFLNSTLEPANQSAVLRAVADGTCRLLYVAPERLPRLTADLLERCLGPTLIAVDEAHCISEWGHDFRPSYRALGQARSAFGWPQVVALTGSATPDVRRDIMDTLRFGVRRRFDLHLASFDRPNLRFEVARVKSDRLRVGVLCEELRREPGCAIVYASTRNTTETIARLLQYRGIRAVPYHAGLTKARRSETLERFLGGDARVTVATCAFGMGIDKPDVRLVLHWSMPPTPESYYQEAGRAGRDGQPSRCLLLYARGDRSLHQLQIGVTFPPEKMVERAWRDPAAFKRLPSGVRASVERLRGELKPGCGRVDWSAVRNRKQLALERLRAVDRYATTRGCRRAVLLGWFGEEIGRCGNCDRCRQ
ncbi:MAG TPA: ATP-dependent DNA helicase RecQ [Gemmatimonadales bacterium]|nr:ATP-dependent DNA helicase RecQ [Gemmatimonadales bacterium]